MLKEIVKTEVSITPSVFVNLAAPLRLSFALLLIILKECRISKKRMDNRENKQINKLTRLTTVYAAAFNNRHAILLFLWKCFLAPLHALKVMLT